MGFFNYFIKCIIRNIAYKLCKPKVFLTVLLCVCILFGLKYYGFCSDWTDGEIEACLDGIATVTANQGTIISQLSSMGVNVSDIETKLNTINTTLNNIKSDTNLTVEKLHNIMQDVDSIHAHIINISNKLDDNQAELISELQSENKKVLTELQQLRDALVGSEATVIEYNYLGSNAVTNSSGASLDNAGKIYVPMEYGYTYKFTLTFTNNTNSNKSIYYFFYDKDVSKSTTIIPVDFILMGYLTPNTSKTFTIVTRDYLNPYLYFGNAGIYKSCSVTGSIEGLVDVIDRTNNEINSGIQEGNQLQEQQNQLQQEQNNFLKQETSNGDVSVDSFNTVDSNDITSDGLTGIFTNIYNSINNWSSKDINLPIPYTNKNIIIPANYTENMLGSFGGGWIITFISSIYYFIVARFIIYSITGIINSIKSGSILETDSKNNITTDML